MPGGHHARYLGNGLRELDRFLSVLIDEIALAGDWDAAALAALVRRRHTADKLVALCARLGLAADDAARLRALACCRAVLFHCNGVVRKGDARRMRTLTLGWPRDAVEGQAATILQRGDRLRVSPAERLWVCAFYRGMADALVHASGPRHATLPFPAHSPI